MLESFIPMLFSNSIKNICRWHKCHLFGEMIQDSTISPSVRQTSVLGGNGYIMVIALYLEAMVISWLLHSTWWQWLYHGYCTGWSSNSSCYKVCYFPDSPAKCWRVSVSHSCVHHAHNLEILIYRKNYLVSLAHLPFPWFQLFTAT